MDELVNKEKEQKRLDDEKEMSRLIEDQQKQSVKKDSTFFFDVKAGIAKPHEKKIYLNHRNISEITAKYDDQGFKEESIGRAYDHGGKDLMALGDPSDDEVIDDDISKSRSISKNSVDASKRKLDHRDQERKRSDDRLAPPKKLRCFETIQVDEKNPCWFCLSSPNVEKHLIIAIGDYCYLTLAKGGLVDEHFLIIPIEHIQSSRSELNRKELLIELEDFKQSIINYFSDQSKGVVFFERNFRSVHWQLQAVPISLDSIAELPLKIKTISKIHYNGSTYIDIPNNCALSDIIPQGAPYFYWQIEPIGSRFACQLQLKGRDSFFPLQFGRVVLADPKILNCPGRIDWKRCAKTLEEYTDLSKLIKHKYKPYDITG